MDDQEWDCYWWNRARIADEARQSLRITPAEWGFICRHLFRDRFALQIDPAFRRLYGIDVVVREPAPWLTCED